MKTAAQIIGTLTALIAVAALIASPAAAATDYGPADGWMYAKQLAGTTASPDDRSFSRATTDFGPPDGWMHAKQLGGTSVSPDDRSFSRAATPGPVGISPDDRTFSRATTGVGTQAAGSRQVGISPDSRNVSIRPQLEQQAALQSASVTVRSPGGFDWTDALIGAAAALAALALAGLGLTAIRRVQPHPRGRLA